MIATTIEQSKYLVVLGIDPCSADMFWLVTNEPRLHVLTEPLSKYSNWENYPAWSLSALLSLLPYPTLTKQYSGDWVCEAYSYHGFPIADELAETPIEAAFKLICRLKSQIKRMDELV